MLYTDLDRFDSNDRTVLGGGDAYKQYFNYLKTVFDQVLRTYQLDVEGKQDEVLLIQTTLKQILVSVNALRNKYLFDPNFKLKIDQSDSSYPSSAEFRRLLDDMVNPLKQLAQIRSREILIQDLVKSIYGLKKSYQDIQYQLALRLYYESLEQKESFFLPFTEGKLSRLEAGADRVKYLYNWGIMEDTLSVPLIYQMVFESTVGYESTEGKEYFDQFLQILVPASKGLVDLIDVAEYFERNLSEVYPKSLKRLTLGPLFGKYSSSNSGIGAFLKGLDRSDAFALLVQSELLISQKELPRRSKNQQQYEIGQTPNCMLRRVTEYRELLFTPHSIGQLLLSQKSLAGEVLPVNIISIQN